MPHALDDAARERREDAPDAVDEHRRAARERRLQRRRARRDHGAVGAEQQVARAARLDAHRQMRGGAARDDPVDGAARALVRGGDGDDEAVESRDRLEHRRQAPLDLAEARARQERHEPRRRVARRARGTGERFRERMAHERREAGREEARLEREEAAQAVERGLDLRDAPGVPRPDLRADDVHRADPLRLRVRRELQVQARIVDRADDVGPPRVDRARHRPLDADEEEKFLQHRPEAHHGKIRRAEAVVAIAAHLVRAEKRLQAPGVEEARLLAR